MNNNIFPCLWFNQTGNEAAKFYTEIFAGNITVDTPVVINFELFGQKIMILNAGPQFEKNESVSFMVLCETDEELQKYWRQLSNGGKVLMELAEYPWCKKFGSVLDKFGVNWQVCLGESTSSQKIVPTLVFGNENNGKAEQAMKRYTEIFPNSKIDGILKYNQRQELENPDVASNIQHAQFTLDGYTFFCMDQSSSLNFDFNEAISMVVMTDNQEETDQLWNSLIENGGRASMCGWLKDQFGFSWQIVPKKLIELMNDSDPYKAQKVMEAMTKMQKINIADLENAYQS